MRIRTEIAVVLLAVFSAGTPAAGSSPPCGPDAPCEIADGTYHLLFPPGPEADVEQPLPAVVFFHGYRSSGSTIFRSRSLAEEFSARGYLIIAPDGALLPETGARGWPSRSTAPGRRDDVGFTLDVLDDVAQRVRLDRSRVYVSGFSSGGSMAWHLACRAGAEFAGFVAVAGALRLPRSPETCPGGPVRLLHFHGFMDKIVPLEGRAIGNWHQGDAFESFAVMRQTNGCRSNPDRIEIGEVFRCRHWISCADGALKVCLHDGGHGLPPGWAAEARKWFEAGHGGPE